MLMGNWNTGPSNLIKSLSFTKQIFLKNCRILKACFGMTYFASSRCKNLDNAQAQTLLIASKSEQILYQWSFLAVEQIW